MRNIRWFLLLIVLAARPADAENKVRAYEIARTHAVEISDVFSGASTHIRAKVMLYPEGIRRQSIEGQYELIQVSKDEYREQMQFKEFEAVTIATPDVVYISRSETFEPMLVEEARKLIHGIQNLPEKMEVNKIDEEAEIEGPQRCFRYVVNFGKSGLANCFDARTGALAKRSIDTANTHEEFAYTEFVRDRDKLYPGRMRGYERGVLAEEVRMIVLEHPESTPPGAFDPPANAFSIPKCKKFEAPQPELTRDFFESTGHLKSGGTVVVAAMLDARGRVTKTKIQQAVDTATDEVATRKVTALKFTAARCDGHPISSSLQLWMWFTPDVQITRTESFPD